MPQTIEDRALPWQRLAITNHHERDDRIQFEEETHAYTIDGTHTGWTSCTGFLHHFFIPFNADECIRKMMNSQGWTSSRYFGMTAQQIKDSWAAKGKAASEAGTRMHLDIEHFYNTAGPWDIATGLKGLAVDDWAPVDGPEWHYFLDFQRDHAMALGLTPFRTEWLVFDEEHKVAGSIDMVFKKPDGTLAIYDWKRVEDLKKENTWQHGLGPVTHLPDTNFWHYSLQLNVYRYILQKHYGVVVSELALVILHPDNEKWRVEPLTMMDEEVAGMMKARALALTKGSGVVVLEGEGRKAKKPRFTH